MADKKVIIPEDMGKTIVFGADKKWNVKTDASLTVKGDGSLSVAQQGGGLDCAAISALPLASWKKGTTILANQDGQCKRLVPQENLFQEVGVTLHGQRLNGFTGETYHVVATVTNSGEAVNTVTDLNIVKPALGTYTVSNFTNSASAGVRVEKINDLQYKIHGLPSGGVAKVEFDVIPTSVGQFQFGANINPNTALDLQGNNNQASITLSATTRADPTYVPSVDCPAIEVTDLTLNKPLILGSIPSNPRSHNKVEESARTNYYANAGTLRLKLKNASTIVVCRRHKAVSNDDIHINTSLKKYFAESNNVLYYPSAEEFPFQTESYGQADASISIISDYKFSGEVLELPTIAGALYQVAMRPKGSNCRWQKLIIQIASTYTLGGCVPQYDADVKVAEEIIDLWSPMKPDATRVNVVTLDTNESFAPMFVEGTGGYLKDTTVPHQATIVKKLKLEIPAGTAKTVNVSNLCQATNTFITKGALTVTPTNNNRGLKIVTTTAVKPTDSVTFGNLRIVIV